MAVGLNLKLVHQTHPDNVHSIMMWGLYPSLELRGTGVPGASQRGQNADRGMIHMLAYSSDDPRQKGYAYQSKTQAEIYVNAELLFELGQGRLFGASS
eukprot:1714967-Prorocentrum_lima.AAC.1